MNKDNSLEENAVHGTKQQPIGFIHFTTGEGTIYPDGFFVQRHWHHSCEILRILKGNYVIELDLESYELHPGDICMVGSGELHQLKGLEKDTLHDVIIFNPRILEFQYGDQFQEEVIAPFLRGEYAFPHILHRDSPGYDVISSTYQQIAAANREGEHLQGGEQDKKSFQNKWYVQAKLGLLSMMNELSVTRQFVKTSHAGTESEKLRIDRYKQLVSYIQEHFAQKLTLEDLSRVVPCNSQYLCHFFKEISGMSPMQFLIEYRIEQAGRMLKDTTKSVLEISLDCGFENVSYFIRQFKRHKNMTPRQYRQSMKKGDK
jgi:AraC-like DNA-binding protein/mannose-6-phosphate isomerase-like protein (cupin superfamily)